jgi:hypothetical protein
MHAMDVIQDIVIGLVAVGAAAVFALMGVAGHHR